MAFFTNLLPDVAQADTRLFRLLVDLLDQALAVLLGHGWQHETDDGTGRVGLHAEVRGDDRLLDVFDQVFVPGFDLDRLRIRNGHGRHALQFHGAPVRLDLDGLDQARGRASGPHGFQFLFKKFQHGGKLTFMRFDGIGHTFAMYAVLHKSDPSVKKSRYSNSR